MNWTRKDLEKIGKIPPKPENSGRKINKLSVEKQTISTVLWVLNRENKIPEYVEEHRFHPERKFRFDWAIPSLKIAIEFEGLMSKKSRHTTVMGYSNDCRKYNLAQICGWKVLRYTVINYTELEEDLKKIFQK